MVEFVYSWCCNVAGHWECVHCWICWPIVRLAEPKLHETYHDIGIVRDMLMFSLHGKATSIETSLFICSLISSLQHAPTWCYPPASSCLKEELSASGSTFPSGSQHRFLQIHSGAKKSPDISDMKAKCVLEGLSIQSWQWRHEPWNNVIMLETKTEIIR